MQLLQNTSITHHKQNDLENQKTICVPKIRKSTSDELYAWLLNQNSQIRKVIRKFRAKHLKHLLKVQNIRPHPKVRENKSEASQSKKIINIQKNLQRSYLKMKSINLSEQAEEGYMQYLLKRSSNIKQKKINECQSIEPEKVISNLDNKQCHKPKIKKYTKSKYYSQEKFIKNNQVLLNKYSSEAEGILPQIKSQPIKYIENPNNITTEFYNKQQLNNKMVKYCREIRRNIDICRIR